MDSRFYIPQVDSKKIDDYRKHSTDVCEVCLGNGGGGGSGDGGDHGNSDGDGEDDGHDNGSHGDNDDGHDNIDGHERRRPRQSQKSSSTKTWKQ